MKLIFLILIAFSVFTGLLMELYKKKIRGDKADDGEIFLVSCAFSAFFGIVTYFILDTSAVPDEIVFSPVLILLFAVLIELFQLPACQALWKPIVKKWLGVKTND